MPFPLVTYPPELREKFERYLIEHHAAVGPEAFKIKPAIDARSLRRPASARTRRRCIDGRKN